VRTVRAGDRRRPRLRRVSGPIENTPLRLLPSAGACDQIQRPDRCWEGGALDGVRTRAAWWCPRSACRGDRANRNLSVALPTRARRPAAAGPSADGRIPTLQRDQGQANELESLLLAVEVKAHQLKPPLVAPAGLHRHLFNDRFGSPGPCPARWALQLLAVGQPTTAVRWTPGTAITPLLWPE